MRRLVRRHAIKDIAKNPPLDRLDARLRSLDKSMPALSLWQEDVSVVLLPRIGFAAMEPTCVGEP